MGNINIELDDELHKKLRVFCAENTVEMKDIVPLFIEQGIINKTLSVKKWKVK